MNFSVGSLQHPKLHLPPSQVPSPKTQRSRPTHISNHPPLAPPLPPRRPPPHRRPLQNPHTPRRLPIPRQLPPPLSPPHRWNPHLLPHDPQRNLQALIVLAQITDQLDNLGLFVLEQAPPHEFFFPEEEEVDEGALAVHGEEGELVGELAGYEGGLDVGGLGKEDGVFVEGGEDARGLGGVFWGGGISSCGLGVDVRRSVPTMPAR